MFVADAPGPHMAPYSCHPHASAKIWFYLQRFFCEGKQDKENIDFAEKALLVLTQPFLFTRYCCQLLFFPLQKDSLVVHLDTEEMAHEIVPVPRVVAWPLDIAVLGRGLHGTIENS